MIEPAEFHAALCAAGVGYWVGVPDSLLKAYGSYLFAEVGSERHVIAANEGSAVALAAGHHLATGELPMLYLQNSGLGNAVNPLLSLAHPDVYGIPMILLVGWRGEPGVADEPQHVRTGASTPSIVEAMGLEWSVLTDDPELLAQQVTAVAGAARAQRAPVALLVRRGTFGDSMPSAAPSSLLLAREEAIRRVYAELSPGAALVATTGKASRELFELVDAPERRRCFFTIGSMGHASQIALAIAAASPERQVVCLDGDGAVIMHMGSLVTIGKQRPPNLLHVLLNNGAHESVGGQPTGALDVDFPAIATACGYQWAGLAQDAEQLDELLVVATAAAGPAFLEVRVRMESRPDLGRPTTSPTENRDAFVAHLRS